MTGRPLGTTTIEQPRALSFVYGLVPPPTVETASKCPSGVAQVETMHSFLNGLRQRPHIRTVHADYDQGHLR